MRFAIAALALSACLTVTASAQSNWEKTYNVSGRPAVQIDVDDASVTTRSCDTCRSIHVYVDGRGSDLSRWHITELQGGNSLHFAMKHREMGNGIFSGWHGQSPTVRIEMPADSDLNLRSGDGSLSVTGIHGAVDIRTGNGSMVLNDVVGAVRASSGDGSVQVNRAEGTLTATTGNGSMNLEGRLSQVEARSGDGSIHVALLPGSMLQSGSRVTTGNGSISMTVPRDLKADVDVSTGDGSVSCNLPMMSSTSTRDRHVIRGSVNGGGVSLRLHSGDGSISLSGR